MREGRVKGLRSERRIKKGAYYNKNALCYPNCFSAFATNRYDTSLERVFRV